MTNLHIEDINPEAISAFAFLNDDAWEVMHRLIWRIIMIIICTMNHDKRLPYFC